MVKLELTTVQRDQLLMLVSRQLLRDASGEPVALQQLWIRLTALEEHGTDEEVEEMHWHLTAYKVWLAVKDIARKPG